MDDTKIEYRDAKGGELRKGFYLDMVRSESYRDLVLQYFTGNFNNDGLPLFEVTEEAISALPKEYVADSIPINGSAWVEVLGSRARWIESKLEAEPVAHFRGIKHPDRNVPLSYRAEKRRKEQQDPYI